MHRLYVKDPAVALANAQADNADLRAINAKYEAERSVLQTHELHPVGTRERIATLEAERDELRASRERWKARAQWLVKKAQENGLDAFTAQIGYDIQRAKSSVLRDQRDQAQRRAALWKERAKFYRWNYQTLFHDLLTASGCTEAGVIMVAAAQVGGQEDAR